MKKSLLFFLFVACTAGADHAALSPADFSARMQEVNTVLLDVRTPAEVAAGALPGAINIDFKSAEFESRAKQLDRTKTYLVYCASGIRSAKAAQQLQALGLSSVFTLAGGLQAWGEQMPAIAR
jgi:rhodanese-related sulfurtransferase